MDLNQDETIRVVSVPPRQRTGEIRTGKMLGSIRFQNANPLDFDLSGMPSQGCNETRLAAKSLADAIQYQGGPLADGAAIQLLFWGSSWNDPTISPQPGEIKAAVQTLLDSSYFFALKQYGVTPGPLGKSLIVKDPAPPSDISDDDITDMLWDLIGDEFPEPDDSGGKNIYVVFLPKDSSPPEAYDGAHNDTTAYDFPFEIHRAWYAWIGFAGNLDGTMTTVSHELVEAFTNPESDKGWVAPDADPPVSELADICAEFTGKVDGVAVTSYYSRFDNQCVIPHGQSLRLFLSTKGIDGSQGIRNHLPVNTCVRGWFLS